ncbi:hypothetical protein [Vibrio sp.]
MVIGYEHNVYTNESTIKLAFKY